MVNAEAFDSRSGNRIQEHRRHGLVAALQGAEILVPLDAERSPTSSMEGFDR